MISALRAASQYGLAKPSVEHPNRDNVERLSTMIFVQPILALEEIDVPTQQTWSLPGKMKNTAKCDKHLHQKMSEEDSPGKRQITPCLQHQSYQITISHGRLDDVDIAEWRAVETRKAEKQRTLLRLHESLQ